MQLAARLIVDGRLERLAVLMAWIRPPGPYTLAQATFTDVVVAPAAGAALSSEPSKTMDEPAITAIPAITKGSDREKW